MAGSGYLNSFLILTSLLLSEKECTSTKASELCTTVVRKSGLSHSLLFREALPTFMLCAQIDVQKGTTLALMF